MAVAQPRRHHLYEVARERFDEPAADTLFDMLEAIETSQVATKADVAVLAGDLRDLRTGLERFATKADLERFATKADLERFATLADLDHSATRSDARFERELRATQARYVTWMLASQAVVIASIGLATAVLIAVLG